MSDRSLPELAVPDLNLPHVDLPDIGFSLTTEGGGHRVVVDLDGRTITTPPVEHLAFYVGLGALAATHVIPPPVAVAVGVGHAILDLTRRPGLRELGAALEEA